MIQKKKQRNFLNPYPYNNMWPFWSTLCGRSYKKGVPKQYEMIFAICIVHKNKKATAIKDDSFFI